MTLMGLLDHDRVRAPLLSLDPIARTALAEQLRALGLVELPGGRIVDRPSEAVA